MRAIIVTTGQPIDPRAGGEPAALLPLLDRPFLQHVVEYCVSQGVRVFDWILCHHAAEIEELLGQGERWGVEFRFHLVPDGARPYGRVATLLSGEAGEEPILLGHADHLPAFALAGLDTALDGPVLFGVRRKGGREESGWNWSGWAVLPPDLCRRCCGRDTRAAGLEQQLRGAAGASWAEVSHLLGMRSLEEVLAANRAVLGQPFPGLLLGGRTVEPQIRMARNVSVAPTATLIGPVCIGADCEIAAGARIGPNAVIGAGCVVDRQARIRDAVVLPGTYVGEALELAHVVVDSDRGVAGLFEGEENMALGSLGGSGLWGPARQLLGRLSGVLLLLLALPLLAAVALVLKLCRPGRVLHRTRVLRLPAAGAAPRATFALWSFCPHEGPGAGREGKAAGLWHFFLRFLPGLVNVARGDLQLVGLPPRLPKEVGRLGADWQLLYLRGKAGLVWESLLSLEKPSAEEEYAIEGVYSVAGSPLRDWGLFGRYLLWVAAGWLRTARPAGLPAPALAASLLPEGLSHAPGRDHWIDREETVEGSERAARHAAHPLLGPHRRLLPAGETVSSPALQGQNTPTTVSEVLEALAD